MKKIFPILLLLTLCAWTGALAQGTHKNYKVETTRATYPGGDKAMYMFLYENIEMPMEARAKGINGKIQVSFVVMEDGTTGEVKALNDLGYGTKEEAERLVKLLKFNPATQNGRNVKMSMIVAVIFS